MSTQIPTPQIPTPQIPTPQNFNPMLAGMIAPAQPESKTNDFRVNMSNSKGDIRSVGILKIWKRFNEVQTASIVARLQEVLDEESQILISSLEEENNNVDVDEF